VLILHWLTRRQAAPAAGVLVGASCGLAIAVPLAGYAAAEALGASGGDGATAFMVAAALVVTCWAWVVQWALNRAAASGRV
jgi:hypothetical protein